MSRPVQIGNLTLGNGNPVRVQSMTNTRTDDVDATVRQILQLTEAGCEIVRVAVPDEASARSIGRIKSRIAIPLVADIHFRHELALIALAEGIDKLRINPGNIGSRKNVEIVVAAARSRNVPIRIGVNSGSVEKDLAARHGGPTADAMVESALRHIAFLEELDYRNIVISLKAADVRTTLAAYRRMASERDYPLHLGITEAGTRWSGSIYSAVGIGALLAEGIGDTLRVSLTADPVEELPVAWEILKSLDLRSRGPRLVSCPTCGRTKVNLIAIAEEVERRLRSVKVPLKVAVMGCEVNGPGEAAEADVGVACGPGCGWIFKKGQKQYRVEEAQIFDTLIREVEQLAKAGAPR